MSLRQPFFDVASSTEGVGKLEETLKWGDPSFLTSETKSGSMIRINWKGKKRNQYAMYFLCQKNLVKTFKKRYPTKLRFEGNQAIIFGIDEQIPIKDLRQCILLALTHKLSKKSKDGDIA
jgi:hypothetical protein